MSSNAEVDRPIRVLVADDTRIHTQLMADALRRDGGLEVITSDSDSRGLATREAIHNIDVLVISSTLDEEPRLGFEVLRSIRASFPAIRAVILMESSKREMVIEAFRAGARGVLSRHESMDKLCKCVRSVHHGQIWANSHQMTIAIEALSSSRHVQAVDATGLNLLSTRELEVVRYLAQGLTNREIAGKLGLSQHTIKNYLFRVFDKLGVSSRVELLHMTLSYEPESQSAFRHLLKTAEGNLHDDASLAECQQAAEQGSPVAQLMLAQRLQARNSDPQDLVNAYSWYMMVSEFISRTVQSAGRTMDMEQLLEAEKNTAEWLRKSSATTRHSFARSEGRPPGRDSVESALPAD
jgi:DNA-binding NarL/FixJ family response regulator